VCVCYSMVCMDLVSLVISGCGWFDSFEMWGSVGVILSVCVVYSFRIINFLLVLLSRVIILFVFRCGSVVLIVVYLLLLILLFLSSLNYIIGL